jgi:hypothetical protein
MIIGTQQKAPRKRQEERDRKIDTEIEREWGRKGMLQKYKKANLTLGLCSTEYVATPFPVQYFV